MSLNAGRFLINSTVGILGFIDVADYLGFSKYEKEEKPVRDLERLRIERNNLLSQSDWVVIKEIEEGGSVSNFAEWKKYRQELRDITKTYESLDKVKFPTPPSE